MSYPNTPYTITRVLTQANRNNVVHYGMADLSNGMVQIDQMNGYGLITRGFLWQLGEIWFYPQEAAPITTTWAYTGASLATGWTASFGYAGSTHTITTTWADSRSFGNEILD